MIQWIDFIGWAGVVVYLASYASLSAGWLRSDSILYHSLNAIGALSLMIFSYSAHDMPNLFVNVIWFAIAGVSLIRILTRKKN